MKWTYEQSKWGKKMGHMLKWSEVENFYFFTLLLLFMIKIVIKALKFIG